MRTDRLQQWLAPALASACVMCGMLAAPRPAMAEDTRDYQVHEWSVWVADPTTNALNDQAQYPTAMPGIVESARRRPRSKTEPRPSPVSMVTFHGKPVENVELEVRILSGSWMAAWPSAEMKGNRLRWIDLALGDPTSTTSDFGYVPADHWFQRARLLKNLAVRKDTRQERFLAYDTVASWHVPIELKGGPDTYQVINKTNRQLEDVLISAPTPQGRRIGWLSALAPGSTASGAKQLGATVPAAGSQAAPNVSPAATAVAGPRLVGANPVVQLAPAVAVPVPPPQAPVAVPAANAAPPPAGAVAVVVAPPGVASPPPTAAPATKPGAASTVTTPGEAASASQSEVVMSAPLAAGSPELRKATTEALEQRLTKTGLTPEESALVTSLYDESIFASEKLVAVIRVPQAILDEQLPMTLYPEPTKVVRTALIIVRNVDPGVAAEVQKLIVLLGDRKYAEREKAQKRLSELGPLALSAVKEAVKHTDPEIATRAERILLDQNQAVPN